MDHLPGSDNGAAKSHDKRVETLVDEHERVGSSMVAIYTALAGVLTVAAVAIGFAASADLGPLAAMGIPAGLAIVVLIALDWLHEIVAQGAYKKWLENEVNAALGPTLLWDSAISTKVTVRAATKLGLWFLAALVLLAASAVSLIGAWRYHGDYTTWVRRGAVVFWSVWYLAMTVGGFEALTVETRVMEAIGRVAPKPAKSSSSNTARRPDTSAL